MMIMKTMMTMMIIVIIIIIIIIIIFMVIIIVIVRQRLSSWKFYHNVLHAFDKYSQVTHQGRVPS